ncbi:MAG: hypothetical protein WDW38_002685 [Sanguina aurantia]
MGTSDSKEVAEEGIVTVLTGTPQAETSAGGTPLGANLDSDNPILQQLAAITQASAAATASLHSSSLQDDTFLGVKEFLLSRAAQEAGALSLDLQGILSGYQIWSKEKAALIASQQGALHVQIREAERRTAAAVKHIER